MLYAALKRDDRSTVSDIKAGTLQLLKVYDVPRTAG